MQSRPSTHLGRWVLLLTLACTVTFNANAADPVVRDAWSRAMPPVSKVGAAYLEIENPGSAAVRLVAASSDVAGRVEIHTHEMDGAMMRMRRLEHVDVAPGETVTFKPHGRHLMLFDLRRALVAGDRFTVELEFEDGRRVKAEAEIRSP